LPLTSQEKERKKRKEGRGAKNPRYGRYIGTLSLLERKKNTTWQMIGYVDTTKQKAKYYARGSLLVAGQEKINFFFD
jgi:hypothetical protein